MTTVLTPPSGTPAPDAAAAFGAPRAAQEAELIPLLRAQIDAIDAGIGRLVAERARLSHRVQTARIAAGGVRIELSRERRILEQYRDSLGDDGVALGSAVLRLCRGPLRSAGRAAPAGHP
jgi:chorismate mutase